MLPTNTPVKVRTAKAIPPKAQAVAVLITDKLQSISPAAPLDPSERRAAGALLASGAASGKPREITPALVELSAGRHRHLLLVGIGPSAKATAESLREAGGAIAKFARQRNFTDIAILTPAASGLDLPDLDDATSADALVTGFALASFRYTEYKGAASNNGDDQRKWSADLTLVTSAGRAAAADAAAQRALIIAEGQNLARTIASRPGNDINPPQLAKLAQDLAKQLRLGIRVLDEKELTRLNMGGILAVGSASAHPPRLIALEYRGGPARAGKSQRTRPVLIVGKAITFDAGGISIKPAEKMGRMIYDKSGGMIVLGVMYALARLKLPVHVVGILSAAENILGSRSYRPGDVLRMHNGVTVEVTNTDAEGRLVLGDALAWGIETYKPTAVVDLATLTGGVVIALGKTMAGVMGNNDNLIADLEKAAQQSGEKIWRLPVGEDQRDQMKSDRADIINSGNREASPLQGAAFLSYFIPTDGSTPWAHLDIAGVADTEKELPYYAKGSTAWGTRTLLNWLSTQSTR